MDIVTHAGIGLIAAGPLMSSHPELALGIVAGSVLPDGDALARLFGKKVFLRAHQTWTHAPAVQAGFSVLAGFVAKAFGLSGIEAGLGLFAGLAAHTFLDYTNTLGVALFAPFSQKRFCLEWIFFIDAVVLSLTVVLAAFTIWRFEQGGEVPVGYAVIFFTGLVAYVIGKARLRRRAGRLEPKALSLIPSALYPWRFFGVIDRKTHLDLFQINALTGLKEDLSEQHVLNGDYAALLSKLPEFRLMAELSPAYRVVGARKTEQGELILCRDLRTRNFGTRFGDLEVLIDADQRMKCVEFHV
jgi:membrane-bound metal-dependent hydrolase YbcI (DUF457 family)